MGLTLNGSSVDIQRAKFRRWSELEDLRDQVSKAVGGKERGDKLASYLSTALDFSAPDVDNLPWLDAAQALNEILLDNAQLRTLPFMRYPSKNSSPPPYDYPGRLFYQYANLLAKTYGWTIDYIANLDVDDAMALMQEILIDQAHRHEWEWDLSERSSGYDSQTKAYKHIPFPLPDWMIPMPPPPKVYRIPKTLIPVGNVVSYRPDAQPA